MTVLIAKTANERSRSKKLYLWNETPGKISIFALRAARFIAVIPLIVKHVTVSSLFKQFENNLRNVDDSSLVGAATATANTADKTINTFILIGFYVISPRPKKLTNTKQIFPKKGF